jgi:hypothetical protein
MVSSDRSRVTDIAGVDVYRLAGDHSVVFQAGMEIDADGAYRAYHPRPDDHEGLDSLDNAGHPGNWFGVETDNGHPNGTPVVQKTDDPAPGFFVSSTALEDRSFDRTDPRRYVDAETIPYIVLGGRVGFDMAHCWNSFEPSESVRENPNPFKKMNSSSVISSQTKQPIPHRRRGVYAVWKRQATIRIRQHGGLLCM